MKKSDKLILILFFLLLNAGAILIISRFFEISWGILAATMVVVLAAIDLPKMLHNRKIKKANESKKKAKSKQLKEEKRIHEEKRQEAIKRQQRMTERNIQNKSRH